MLPCIQSSISGKPLSSLGLPLNSKYCLVLGRLFKLHPDFDKAVANIVLYSERNSFVVFVTEFVSSWNDIVFRRLSHAIDLIYQDLLESGNLPIADQSSSEVALDPAAPVSDDSMTSPRTILHSGNRYYALSEYLAKIRFVHYGEGYVDAIESATVVLDTFPYGGKCT